MSRTRQLCQAWESLGELHALSVPSPSSPARPPLASPSSKPATRFSLHPSPYFSSPKQPVPPAQWMLRHRCPRHTPSGSSSPPHPPPVSIVCPSASVIPSAPMAILLPDHPKFPGLMHGLMLSPLPQGCGHGCQYVSASFASRPQTSSTFKRTGDFFGKPHPIVGPPDAWPSNEYSDYAWSPQAPNDGEEWITIRTKT